MMKRILTITALILIHFHALAYYPTVHNFTKEEYKGGAQNWAITHGVTGGGSADPEEFNYAMFDFRRMVAAPVVIISGIIIEVVAIMKIFRS